MTLIAEKEQIIIAYSYDEDDKHLIGSFEYHWAVGTGLAAQSTHIAPPVFKLGQIPIYNETAKQWTIVEDHRLKMVYSTETKLKEYIDYIGPIKDGFTLLEPFDFATWNGNAWEDQRTSEEISAYERSLLKKLSKRQFSLYLYDHNIYDTVMTTIEQNPRFKIEYDIFSEMERLSPTAAEMSKVLGWSNAQMDAMWIEALTL